MEKCLVMFWTYVDWVYQDAKGHVLIPSHLIEMSIRLLVPSNVPKMVQVEKIQIRFINMCI